jgi:hypothetical protein
MAEKKGDEEASDSAIAIKKRMDGLKLRVSESTLDEQRERVVMEKPLHIIQRLMHFVDRRRHEGCGTECASRWANPVLTGAKLAWGAVRATDPFEQLAMDFTD